MKLTLDTSLLQALVAKSTRGSSNNKLIPLSSLMCISRKDGQLKLITTDGTNYLYILHDVPGDDFYVVAQTDILAKLIARLTCDKVSLDVTDNKLTVIGNGKYTIELPVDENGDPIVFTDPVAKSTFDGTTTVINLSTVKLMLDSAKQAILKSDQELLCYTGYYVGDKIITTDTCKICGIDISVFDTPILLHEASVDLLNIMSEEKISANLGSDAVIFSTSDCVLYSKLPLNNFLEDFNIDILSSFLADTYNSSCKVPKTPMMQLLDRLSLFVGPYDENCVRLTFGQSGIQVSSDHTDSSELIEYVASSNYAPFTCRIDVERFKEQVKANVGDNLEIHYGKAAAIKLVDANITQIVALEDD